MGKKSHPNVPDFSSHKPQAGKPKLAKDALHAPAPHPAPAAAPKLHAPKTSGHRGA
jgi:hypothetical protein